MKSNIIPRPALAFRAAPLALVSALLVAACGGSGADISRSNPGFFSVRSKDGQMTGQYNPAGYSADDVRKLLAGNCGSGKLGSYGEQAGDGLVSFTATCTGQAAPQGSFEFEKAAEGVVAEQTTADENGNISYGRSTVSL